MDKSDDREDYLGTLAFITVIAQFLSVFDAWADPATVFSQAVYVPDVFFTSVLTDPGEREN